MQVHHISLTQVPSKKPPSVEWTVWRVVELYSGRVSRHLALWGEQKTDRWTRAMSAVMWTLYWSVVVKRELSVKAKLSIYWSFYIPAFSCGDLKWQGEEFNYLEGQIRAATPPHSMEVAWGYLRLWPEWGGPEVDPGHAGEIMAPSWPWNALVFLKMSWRR